MFLRTPLIRRSSPLEYSHLHHTPAYVSIRQQAHPIKRSQNSPVIKVQIIPKSPSTIRIPKSKKNNNNDIEKFYNKFVGLRSGHRQ